MSSVGTIPIVLLSPPLPLLQGYPALPSRNRVGDRNAAFSRLADSGAFGATEGSGKIDRP